MFFNTLTSERAVKLAPPRRVKLVAMALLFIALSLVGFASFALVPDTFAALSGIVVSYPKYIRLTNAALALICATFLLWPREGGRLVGHWNEYVGLAFFIFFVQYGCRSLALLVEPARTPDLYLVVERVTTLVVFLCSFANNLLFLAAARTLLNKNRRPQTVAPQPGNLMPKTKLRRRWAMFKTELRRRWAMFRNALPEWRWPAWAALVLLTCALPLIEDWFYLHLLWVRIPDAIFSTYCLSWFAYAVWLSFSVRGLRWLAWMAFVVVLAYAAGQHIFAINPFIAHSISEPPHSQTPPAKWFRDKLGPEVTRARSKYLEAAHVTDKSGLVRKLTVQQDEDPFSRYIFDHPQTEGLGQLRRMPGAPPPDPAPGGQDRLLSVLYELNLRLDLPLLGGVPVDRLTMRDETRRLLAEARAGGGHSRLLNRMLLEDAYPTEIKRSVTPGAFFDGAIFAILFPMKYLLFLTGFVLYLLIISSVNDFRKALRKTTNKRMDYLSGRGVIGVIGRSMGADEVNVIIRLPGVKRRQGGSEEHVVAETWRRGGTTVGRKIYPVSDDMEIFRAMRTEGRIKVVTNEDKCEAAAELRKVGPSPQTLVIIPIRFHGGVIGVLRVIFRGYGKYNDGTLEQLRFMAELIAPSVQDFRTVAAVDKLGPRLSRAQSEAAQQLQHAAERVGPAQGRPGEGFADTAQRMVEALHDLLSPLGVGFIIESGFTSLKPIYPKEGPYFEILNEQGVSYEEKQSKSAKTPEGPVSVETDLLPLRTEKGTPYYLGNLILAIPRYRDAFARPTLAAYYLTRRMVASLIAQSISNAARTALLTIIQELNHDLGKETLNVGEWFKGVQAAITKAGLLWVVASEGDGRPKLGPGERVELVESLTSEEQENLMGKPLGCVPYGDAESDTRHVIHVEMGEAGRGLWLGVSRAHFGRELNFESPWRVFLESLASSTGAALSRIEERREAEVRRQLEEEERVKAAEDELVETMGLISGLLMHELVNMVANQSFTVDGLLEVIGGDGATLDGQLITSLKAIKESAAMMNDLTSACREIMQVNDRSCSCSVRDAARQALRLFQGGARKKQIEVVNDIPRRAVARVPSNFVALACASLIGNGIDAIKSKGVIRLAAEIDSTRGVILCHVIDDGEPIPKHIQEGLFKRGTTNKKGHNGWGLYLVARFLRKYGGDAYLSYSTPKATCLTLRLPASTDGAGSTLSS